MSTCNERVSSYYLTLAYRSLIVQIFFYLDFNNNGLLDQDELLLGFVMLANSSEKEKIEAAFSIVDENGSGTLDINEMTKYMRSVIRMGDGRKFNTDVSAGSVIVGRQNE